MTDDLKLALKTIALSLYFMGRCKMCNKNIQSDLEYHFERFHPELIASNRSPNRLRKTSIIKRKKIVVDGNNVAYFGGTPKVKNLKICRGRLQKLGYDVIIIISSALIHSIDDKAELLRMQRLNWITTAENDVSDDIEVIEMAMRYSCEIVTNDRFLDHQPVYAQMFDFSKLRKFRISDKKFYID